MINDQLTINFYKTQTTILLVLSRIAGNSHSLVKTQKNENRNNNENNQTKHKNAVNLGKTGRSSYDPPLSPWSPLRLVDFSSLPRSYLFLPASSFSFSSCFILFFLVLTSETELPVNSFVGMTTNGHVIIPGSVKRWRSSQYFKIDGILTTIILQTTKLFFPKYICTFCRFNSFQQHFIVKRRIIEYFA